MVYAKFKIEGTPTGKGRHRSQITANGSIHTYTPEKTVMYEERVKWSYRQQCGRVRINGAMIVTINAFYAIPKSWSKSRKQAAAAHELVPQIKPDADNIAKIILDSLNGLAYDDDKGVVELHIFKNYTDGDPYVEVYISELEA